MKVSAPTISRDDQMAFAKVEKLRGRDPDDIRRALEMVCGKGALERSDISSIIASVDALDTEDQISYVKVETLRKINPIMDIHRAVQNVCGSRTFSSSTFSRWSKSFRQGKSVRLGYDKPVETVETVQPRVQLIKKIIKMEDNSSEDKGESSEIAEDSDTEENSN